jgi:cytochrome c553
MTMKRLLGPASGLMALVLTVSAPLAQTPAPTADIEAGKRLSIAVCAACHGGNGVSVNDATPNLAAQKAGYLATQLRAFRDGTRKAAHAMSPTVLMEAIAAQLSNEDIANVSAYLATLPGAAPGARSQPLPHIAKSRMLFPEGYKESFTHYHSMNFPATKQVRHFYANAVTITAAKAGRDLPDGSVMIVEVFGAKLDAEGKPVIGPDGFFVADKLLFYTAMAAESGWGDQIPDMLRNGNWQYAVFTPEKQQRAGLDQTNCLACHKPLEKKSYTFTLKQLSEVK